MTLSELITFIDGIKPNAYTAEEKTAWINECEGLVQTEVFLLAEVCEHLYSSTQSVTVSFPDTQTAVFAEKPSVRKYGYLTFSDLTTNNVKAKIQDISPDGLTRSVAAHACNP